MKIGILGAGAVGGYFGGMLTKAGESVGFVARGKTLETLQSKGLTIIEGSESPKTYGHVDYGLGDETTTEVIKGFETGHSFAELAEKMGGLDVILVATKALPRGETFPHVSDLESVAESGVPVVTVHNSVEIPHLAAELFGPENVIPGIVRGYFINLGPAKVQFLPPLKRLDVGTFEGEQDSRSHAVAAALVKALRGAGFGSNVLKDVFVDIWTKAMFVTPMGSLGALAEQPAGYLRGPLLRTSLEGMVREFEAAALGHGVKLPRDIVATTMHFLDQQPAGSTTSMQRDIMAGLPNELDSQVGALRRMAAKVDIATPLTDLVDGALNGRLNK